MEQEFSTEDQTSETKQQEEKPRNLKRKHPECCSIGKSTATGRLLKKHISKDFLVQQPGSDENGEPLYYIEANKVFDLANDIFGFDGWSHSILEQNVDYECEENGRYTCAFVTHVRVELAATRTYHEDIGYGVVENASSKAQASELARKKSIDDGVKRALRFYGNALGNCLSDIEYLVHSFSRPPQPPSQEPELVTQSTELRETDTNEVCLEEENLCASNLATVSSELLSTCTPSVSRTLDNSHDETVTVKPVSNSRRNKPPPSCVDNTIDCIIIDDDEGDDTALAEKTIKKHRDSAKSHFSSPVETDDSITIEPPVTADDVCDNPVIAELLRPSQPFRKYTKMSSRFYRTDFTLDTTESLRLNELQGRQIVYSVVRRIPGLPTTIGSLESSSKTCRSYWGEEQIF